MREKVFGKYELDELPVRCNQSPTALSLRGPLGPWQSPGTHCEIEPSARRFPRSLRSLGMTDGVDGLINLNLTKR